MKIIRSKEFTADRAWGAMDVANMNGITTLAPSTSDTATPVTAHAPPQ
jgi:hypothetical protein